MKMDETYKKVIKPAIIFFEIFVVIVLLTTVFELTVFISQISFPKISKELAKPFYYRGLLGYVIALQFFSIGVSDKTLKIS